MILKGMFKLAFASNAFKKNSLAEAIDCVAAIGYAGVELMADLHHAYPSTFDAARRRDTQKQLSDRGLNISNVNAFTCFVQGDTYHPTWIEHDPKLRQARIDHTLKCIDMTAEFGGRTISLQPGGPMIGMNISYAQAAERFAESLSKCVDTATRANVILAIEPEPGLLIQSAQEYIDFKTRFFPHADCVKMNADLGHLYCVGDDPAAVIRQHHEHIAHVHLEDIGKNRVHQHLTPGKGAIDFRSIFKALTETNYAGWATVELYPYETTAGGVAKAAWDYLAPIVAQYRTSAHNK